MPPGPGEVAGEEAAAAKISPDRGALRSPELGPGKADAAWLLMRVEAEASEAPSQREEHWGQLAAPQG